MRVMLTKVEITLQGKLSAEKIYFKPDFFNRPHRFFA